MALDRPYVIGGDSSADVVVDDPSLLSRHARVAPGPGGAMLQPLAGALVTVNGSPLSRATVLQDGVWLVLGSAAFQVRIASPAGETPSSPGAPAERVTFGRLADCTIQIDSPLVSREHARLEKSGDQWIIADRGSTNGTFVNGHRPSNPHALKAGDRIDIATFGFLFTGLRDFARLSLAAWGAVPAQCLAVYVGNT